jgi:hypothetical protein
MKYAHVYALFLMLVFYTSCKGQVKTEPKENIKSETRDINTSHGLTASPVISYKIERATFGLLHLMVFSGTMGSLLPILPVK